MTIHLPFFNDFFLLIIWYKKGKFFPSGRYTWAELIFDELAVGKMMNHSINSIQWLSFQRKKTWLFDFNLNKRKKILLIISIRKFLAMQTNKWENNTIDDSKISISIPNMIMSMLPLLILMVCFFLFFLLDCLGETIH